MNNNAPAAVSAFRLQFQGPVLTLTLKDPTISRSIRSNVIVVDKDSDDHYKHQQKKTPYPKPTDNGDDQPKMTKDTTNSMTTTTSSTLSPKTHASWWNLLRHNLNTRKNASSIHSSSSAFLANILNLDSLAPTILCSLRTIQTPLPNYLPSLKAASLTAAYNYNELKTKPSAIETDISFYSNTLELELDIASTYNLRQKQQDLIVRLGRDSAPEHMDATSTNSRTSGKGFYGLIQFVRHKGRHMLLQHASGQYRFHLPFQTIGSVSITPSYDFQQQKPTCSIVGKSGSGRTATLLDLNWDRPTLSVVHALDEKNTIQPEISLYDAKILYNWTFKLMDGSGLIKTRVDPTSAIQVTWIDQSRNGKWVTDFRLPLVGMAGGPMMGDIRVRRQFVF